jgi:hypothetical protein
LAHPELARRGHLRGNDYAHGTATPVFSTYILGPLLTLLPRPWRTRVFAAAAIQAARAAAVSGILESVAALAGLIAWYSFYVTLAADAISRSPLPGAGSPRIGLFGHVWFWLNPITWAVAYFGLEGVTRALAALITGEVYGTLPLAIAEYLTRIPKLRRADTERPLIADEILPGGATCDMKIASCRSKTDWKYPFTILYGGAYFQVVASLALAAGPRPYVYSLRRLPHGEVARGLKDYHPEDVLATPAGRRNR